MLAAVANSVGCMELLLKHLPLRQVQALAHCRYNEMHMQPRTALQLVLNEAFNPMDGFPHKELGMIHSVMWKYRACLHTLISKGADLNVLNERQHKVLHPALVEMADA